jgi:hypothetical protein
MSWQFLRDATREGTRLVLPFHEVSNIQNSDVGEPYLMETIMESTNHIYSGRATRAEATVILKQRGNMDNIYDTYTLNTSFGESLTCNKNAS